MYGIIKKENGGKVFLSALCVVSINRHCTHNPSMLGGGRRVSRKLMTDMMKELNLSALLKNGVVPVRYPFSKGLLMNARNLALKLEELLEEDKDHYIMELHQ